RGGDQEDASVSASAKLSDEERELVEDGLEPMILPEIVIKAGQQPWIVDDAERVLIENATRLRIFQRGSDLVRLIALDSETKSGGLRRPIGTVQLQPLSVAYLQDVWGRIIAWRRTVKPSKKNSGAKSIPID